MVTQIVTKTLKRYINKMFRHINSITRIKTNDPSLNDRNSVSCDVKKFEFVPSDAHVKLGYRNKTRLIRNINSNAYIELKQLPNEKWVIELIPYHMYWHNELKQFVIYTQPKDFSKNTQLGESEAFVLFYTSDLISEHNNNLNMSNR